MEVVKLVTWASPGIRTDELVVESEFVGLSTCPEHYTLVVEVLRVAAVERIYFGSQESAFELESGSINPESRIFLWGSRYAQLVLQSRSL